MSDCPQRPGCPQKTECLSFNLLSWVMCTSLLMLSCCLLIHCMSTREYELFVIVLSYRFVVSFRRILRLMLLFALLSGEGELSCYCCVRSVIRV